MEEIKPQPPDHDVFYIGNTAGFQLSEIPIDGEAYICRKIQESINSETSVVEAITLQSANPTSPVHTRPNLDSRNN